MAKLGRLIAGHRDRHGSIAVSVCVEHWPVFSSPTDMELQDGEAVSIEAQEHTIENPGASEFRVILVELK